MNQTLIDRLFALKDELEQMGAKVDISIKIAVDKPAEPESQDRSLSAFKAMVTRGNFLVLDTETTGLERGEICQIAIIDWLGNVLLDTLVKPVGKIPADASRIHGIYDRDVIDAPSWALLSPSIEKLLSGRDVVIYNAVYDRKMMHQSAEAARLPKTDWKGIARFWCAMEAFAEVYGDWNGYRNSYRWQKLTTAASYYNVPIDNAHSALGDCLMTLEVVKGIAGIPKSTGNAQSLTPLSPIGDDDNEY